MTSDQVTLVNQAIHNPAEPRHFMRVKPASGTVEARVGEILLARTANALRILEAGRDLYDPVIYFPNADLLEDLVPLDTKTTYCPIKGKASYWSLPGSDAKLAWRYDDPLDCAKELAGHTAFYSNQVTLIFAP